MIKPERTQKLSTYSLEELIGLNGRLYCAWNCVFYGDQMLIDHQETVGHELREIQEQIDAILELEKERQAYDREEMKKFTEGFAYRPTDGQVLD